MGMIYQTQFSKIGAFAQDALAENMLITFKQGAPADLEDYCFIHQHGELLDEVQVGDELILGNYHYKISAVGAVASFNLRELGHVTFRFDGANIAEYPGTIHLVGEVPTEIEIHSEFNICRH